MGSWGGVWAADAVEGGWAVVEGGGCDVVDDTGAGVVVIAAAAAAIVVVAVEGSGGGWVDSAEIVDGAIVAAVIGAGSGTRVAVVVVVVVEDGEGVGGAVVGASVAGVVGMAGPIEDSAGAGADGGTGANAGCCWAPMANLITKVNRIHSVNCCCIFCVGFWFPLIGLVSV